MLNMNFEQQVIIDTNKLQWQASSKAGVFRKPLAQDEEIDYGHVTSIVRYDAGSHFSLHPYIKSEEIYVIEGTFSDERSHHLR